MPAHRPIPAAQIGPRGPRGVSAALAGTRRSRSPHDPVGGDAPAFERLADGSVVVRSMELARAVLRAGAQVRQAGFNSESMQRRGLPLKRPILFQEGDEHRQQRIATAHYFTPVAASERYRAMMEDLADALVDELRRAGGGDLSAIGMRLAVRVAAEVVGLTDSLDGRMDRRLDAFFAIDPAPFSWRPDRLFTFLRTQGRMLRFYRHDVRPAIRARRAAPRDDVISHLIGKGYRDPDILIEAITFGAAGMVTTREFISMAAWHLLEDDALRSDYLARDVEDRKRFLSELVRLEPVVGRLFRRVTEGLTLEVGGRSETLAPGTLVAVDLRGANADEQAVGSEPLTLRPDRVIPAKGVQPYALAFGDGHHRCPGAYLALEEADVFLTRLLRLPGLRIASGPTLGFGKLAQGYELREFMLAV
ncbi:MAG TPA: cytochrome P450 [Trueperaceae bacterium]|nr:cytochrome P450 [Trueperaceae bacterium]